MLLSEGRRITPNGLQCRGRATPKEIDLSVVAIPLSVRWRSNPRPPARFWQTSLSQNILTLECIPGFILLVVHKSRSNSLRSGALAKATGVSPDTIRHYERIGVLQPAPRTDSGYRVYSANAVERVLVIQRALRIGFTLAELAEVLKARDAGGAPCHRVYQLAQEKLKGIEADLEALKRTKRYVKKVLADWEQRIQRTRGRQKSYLLHSLGDVEMNAGPPANQFRRKKRP